MNEVKMNEIFMNIHIDPSTIPTAQQKGVRVVGHRAMFYTKAKVRQGMEALKAEISRHVTSEWRPSPDAALRVRIMFVFGYPKSASKAERSHDSYMTRRPDLDNMVKGLLDAMTQVGVWCDDSQVAEIHAEKIRSSWTKPFIAVTVTEVTEVWK